MLNGCVLKIKVLIDFAIICFVYATDYLCESLVVEIENELEPTYGSSLCEHQLSL